MFKKSLFFVFFVLTVNVLFSQEKKDHFSKENRMEFKHFIDSQKFDSAYLYLNSLSANDTSVYSAWEELAYAYWGKGNLSNTATIAFWLRGKINLFSNPNEFYPKLYHLIGNVYFTQNQLDSAIANYQRVIDYRIKNTDINDTLLIDTYQNISQVYSIRSDSANTFLYLEKARDILFLQSDNNLEFAAINARYADSYTRLSYYDLAEKYYREAILVLDSLNPKHQLELATIYAQKGRLNYFLGNFTNSIKLYSDALRLMNNIKAADIEKEKVIENLANAHYMLKDYQGALQKYQQALALLKGIFPSNHKRIIALHTDLASTYKGLDDTKNAILHFRLAASQGSLNAYQYRVFGESYWKADSLEQAEAMLSLANKLAEEKVPVDKKELAETHFSLGAFYLDTKRNPLVGLFYLNLAVGEFTELSGPKSESLGRTLLAQAKYFIATGELEKALEIIQSSIIALSPGFDSKNILDNPSGLQLNIQSTANSLGWKALALAKYYQSTKDIVYLKASFNTYVLALKMVESFRLSQKYSTNLILNKEVNNLLNQAILVSNQLYGLTHEDLYFQSTFAFIEKNKSTALLSSLQQNDSLRLANVPKTLVLKENNLKQDLLSLQEKINQLLPEPNTANANLLASYIKLRSEYRRELDSVQLILVTNYPDYYRLFYGNQSISIANVQEMLADNQVLLDYSLTDTLLLVYAISKEKTQLVTKTKNSVFTNSIQRLLQLIRHVNTDNSKSDFNAYTKLAWENYQFLLGDLNETIEGKDVLIVPDGILSYLPFDVLLTEEVKNEQPNYRNLPYFVFKNTSSIINSAAIYFGYSQKKKPNYGKIIAFAPVYSLFDTLSSGNEDQYALMPLVHVKEELQSINSVFNPILFQGENASKANFQENADHASILHLAMHAVLNDQDPLRSQLVFAPNQHDKSASLFEVEELFGMKLNADLAVLSACNSGNGKLNTGEGILSLSTGFQYAGVPSVVMSHWDVNDKYSAVLMSSFYYYLAQGKAKNHALHQAKVDLLKNGNSLYSHPYYWAGFTLIGNESAVVSRKSGSGKRLEMVIPFFLIAFMFYRKRKIGNG